MTKAERALLICVAKALLELLHHVGFANMGRMEVILERAIIRVQKEKDASQQKKKS